MNEWLSTLPARAVASLLMLRGVWALWRDFRRWEKELGDQVAWRRGEVHVDRDTRQRLAKDTRPRAAS